MSEKEPTPVEVAESSLWAAIEQVQLTAAAGHVPMTVWELVEDNIQAFAAAIRRAAAEEERHG